MPFRPLRIAALVKQVPRFEALALGDDGRLVRDGLELELNPYCRRAVGKGTELVAARGGELVVISLGPPSASDAIRESLAWADQHGATARGILVSDHVFAGSDTLATARVLAATLTQVGPFDLILAGRNSVDADTGQVGPEVAELLDLAFLTAVRDLEVGDSSLEARCEYDDGFVEASAALPAIVSVAERLCEPCKVDPAGRAAVDGARITVLTAAGLGSGPWGHEASPTRVGPVRLHEVARERHISHGPVADQVHDALKLLLARGALGGQRTPCRELPSGDQHAGEVAVLCEPQRDTSSRELLGAARELGSVATAVALAGEHELTTWWEWGADHVVALAGAEVEEDFAHAAAGWIERHPVWGVLAPSTAWGREVAARIAARLGAGLTGDAVELERQGDRLVAWKPAFGGALVAAIESSSPVQMATIRPGVLPDRASRAGGGPSQTVEVTHVAVNRRGRVTVRSRSRDDDVEVLATAPAVIGVGTGVGPDEYAALDPLRTVLAAEMGATRKVTDKGWMPRARQIGITGRSIAPCLYVAIGIAGKFNHMVGVRAAATVLAINRDPDALVFGASDIGIVADWREAVPLLVKEIEAHKGAT